MIALALMAQRLAGLAPAERPRRLRRREDQLDDLEGRTSCRLTPTARCSAALARPPVTAPMNALRTESASWSRKMVEGAWWALARSPRARRPGSSRRYATDGAANPSRRATVRMSPVCGAWAASTRASEWREGPAGAGSCRKNTIIVTASWSSVSGVSPVHP
jgi:hypothetical protein